MDKSATRAARRGATGLTYALLLGLIALIGLAALMVAGNGAAAIFKLLADRLGTPQAIAQSTPQNLPDCTAAGQTDCVIRAGRPIYASSAGACVDNALNAAACVTAANRYVTATVRTSQTGTWTNADGDDTLSVPVPAGYWDGTATLAIRDANLVAARIRTGSTIFGVASAGSDGTAGNPGISCRDLYNNNIRASTTYWIQPAGQAPQLVYCDQGADGGGWALVFKGNNLTLGVGETNANLLQSNTYGTAAKYSDAYINSLGFTSVRVQPSGTGLVPFFFNPGVPWNFGANVALNGVPVCTNEALNTGCVTKTGINTSPSYQGYVTFNGETGSNFIFNHGGNLGYAGRAPFALDGAQAKVWVR